MHHHDKPHKHGEFGEGLNLIARSKTSSAAFKLRFRSVRIRRSGAWRRTVPVGGWSWKVNFVFLPTNKNTIKADGKSLRACTEDVNTRWQLVDTHCALPFLPSRNPTLNKCNCPARLSWINFICFLTIFSAWPRLCKLLIRHECGISRDLLKYSATLAFLVF